MFPHYLRTARVSLARFGIALLAIAAAQFAFTASSLAAPGYLYATDLASGSIIVYAPDGTPTTFATGLISPQGIAFDTATGTMAGYFYVADAGDGGPTSGIVYRYDRAGNRTTFFTGLNNPIGVALDAGDIIVAENGADRIRSIPVDGSASTISLLVATPMGIDTHAFDQSGFLNKFIATGASVFNVSPGQHGTSVDIDPGDGSRTVGVDPVAGDVFVTTDAGTISKLQPDGTSKVQFASGLTDPHGLAFVPPGTAAAPGVYVADTSAGAITRILPDGTKVPFVTGAGNPNYITFENFSPPDPTPAPIVVTGVASSIGDTTATLNGTVNPSGSATTYQFQYGLTVSYGSTTPSTSAGSGSTAVPVSAPLTGLTPGTVYHFRVTATNGGGTANGVDRTFTTFALPPTPTPTPTPIVVTADASNIGETTATLNGTVNPDGSDTTYQFEYGSTASYGSTTSMTSAGNGFTEVPVSADLTGLSPGTYHFRVTATNDGGTANGEDALFTTAGATPPADKAQNLSTRVDVQTGANLGIGGFIITGTEPKLVVIRAIGPSLTDFGVVGALADPVLELHDSSQAIIATNDNWMENTPEDQATLTDDMLAPTNDLESAIIKTLDPGLYTAVVSGKDGGTGVALIEIYDLDDPTDATKGELGNLSTRGLVGTDANVLIGGVIIGPEGGSDAAVVVRAIGPSLTDFGVTGALADPVLELKNAQGVTIASNDNWMENSPEDQATLTADMLAPTNDLESAIVANLVSGLYTATVTGKDGTTGVGLVEVYHVAAQPANSASH